jgi:hypothetical protein
MPFTQLKELNDAVKKDDVELVKQFCTLATDEAPTADDLAAALDDAAQMARVKVVKYLCEEGNVNSFAVTQVLINLCNLEHVHYDEKKEILSYLCALKTYNRPHGTGINAALLTAEKNNDWDFFKILCELPEINAPSQEILGTILNRQLESGKPFLDLMKHIFEKGSNQPSQQDVCKALKFLCKHKVTRADSEYWDYISFLCDLKGKNKPDQKAINKAFIVATGSKITKLVRKLCLLDVDNAPDQKIVIEKFNQFVRYSSDLKSLRIITIICEDRVNDLTSDIVALALADALKTNFPKNKAYISYLSNLKSEIKPDQTAINQALESFAHEAQWDLVELLCLNENNPPSQTAIGKVLKIAVIGNSELPLDSMISLFEKSAVKPNKEAVSTTLIDLCNLKVKEDSESNYWRHINYLLSLSGENKPNQNALNVVSDLAFLVNKDALLGELCTREGEDNAPSALILEQILIEFVSFSNQPESMALIKLIAEKSTSKPSKDAINKAFQAAIKAHNNYSVEKLVEIVGDNELDQDLINTRLIELAGEDGYLDMVQCLCELKTKAPGQEIMAAAAKKVEALIENSAEGQYLQIAEYLKSRLLIDSSNTELPDNTIETEKVHSTVEIKEIITEIKETNNPTETKETMVSQAIIMQRPTISSLLENYLFSLSVETKSKTPKNSCFSDAQIEEITAQIDELRKELRGCLSFFYPNKDRKKEKISGLQELIRIGQEPNMTIADAIEKIGKDARFPDLRSGIISHRTGDLLDKLLVSNENMVLICR